MIRMDKRDQFRIIGSTHSDQYPFLMGNGNFNYTQDDLTVKWLIQEAFVQFVKTGLNKSQSHNLSIK